MIEPSLRYLRSKVLRFFFETPCMYLSICILYLFIYESNYHVSSIYQSIYQSISSIYQSIFSFNLSIYLCHLSIPLSICLSVCFIYQSTLLCQDIIFDIHDFMINSIYVYMCMCTPHIYIFWRLYIQSADLLYLETFLLQNVFNRSFFQNILREMKDKTKIKAK